MDIKEALEIVLETAEQHIRLLKEIGHVQMPDADYHTVDTAIDTVKELLNEKKKLS